MVRFHRFESLFWVSAGCLPIQKIIRCPTWWKWNASSECKLRFYSLYFQIFVFPFHISCITNRDDEDGVSGDDSDDDGGNDDDELGDDGDDDSKDDDDGKDDDD